MDVKDADDNRGRQIRVGGMILAAIAVLVIGLLVGWRLIPGWVGESFGMVAGILSTPFFMEGSFVVIGLVTILGLNIWRRRKEGDEFVEFEFENGPKDSSGDPEAK